MHMEKRKRKRFCCPDVELLLPLQLQILTEREWTDSNFQPMASSGSLAGQRSPQKQQNLCLYHWGMCISGRPPVFPGHHSCNHSPCSIQKHLSAFEV